MAQDTERIAELFQGFSKLSRPERLKRLVEMGVLTPADVAELNQQSHLDPEIAENFIENVIGYFQMPLGVAANFVIDGRPVVVPMAVEETSIIAAASKTAKWVRDHGRLTTAIEGATIIGQIQLAHVRDFAHFERLIMGERERLVADANREVAHGLVARGGGVRDLKVRRLERETADSVMAVVHVYMDPCDAMGANIINQVCEYLRWPIESLTGEKVTMCILSNLVDSKITRAQIRLRDVPADLRAKISEASFFAENDPYRAATHNKGVLNGIDPILLATGNDWRAVEAGIHAYAARTGQYRSVTRWWEEGDELVGEFAAPVVVGIVGGVTRLHPTAALSLRMMGVRSAGELSRICAAVGLVQNLGALRALTTVGIIEGHMKLHIRNLIMGAGALEKEMPLLQERMEHILMMTKKISLQNVVEALRELRHQS